MANIKDSTTIKVIPINTTVDLYFDQLALLLKPVLRITDQECKVLAHILKVFNSTTNLNLDQKNIMALGAIGRKGIEEDLNISAARLRNILHSFRKKRIVVDDKFVLHTYSEIGNRHDLIFKFTINESD